MKGQQIEGFVFYRGFRDAIKELPQEYQLKVLQYVMDYALDGTEPEEGGIEKAMFLSFKPQIDAAQKRYSAKVENGKKGGRPKNEQEETETEKNPELGFENENRKKPNHNLGLELGFENENRKKPNHNLGLELGFESENRKKPNHNLNNNINDNVNDNININSPKGEVQKGENPPAPLGEKNSQQQELKNILDSFTFTPALRQKVEEWLTYKKERRKSYKPTGLHNLLVQIQNQCQSHGERAVIEIISRSMANNYEGILWGKIGEGVQPRGQSAQNPVKQNRFVNYEQRNWNFAELERLERERMEKQRLYERGERSVKDSRYAAILERAEMEQ